MIPGAECTNNPVDEGRAVSEDRSIRVSSQSPSKARRNDARFRRPRQLPSLSRWDARNPDSPKLLHPLPNPPWMERLQRYLPWHGTTLGSGGGPWLSLRAWDVPYGHIWDELRYRWDNPGDRALLIVRVAVIYTLLLVLVLINVAELGVFYADTTHVPTLWDWFHQVTIPTNKWIHESDIGYSVLMCLAGFLMDILFLWMFLYWMILGDSLRLPITYALFYGLRAVQRFYCILPYPNGYKWEHPHLGSFQWVSLVVPYITGNDFFFSGHVGCGVIAISEHYYNRCWWGVAYSIFVVLFEAFWLVTTRGHYAIDIFTGAIVASWSHMIAQRVSRPADQWLSLPPRPIVPDGYADLPNPPLPSAGDSPEPRRTGDNNSSENKIDQESVSPRHDENF